jgi:hypothetical protein
MFSRGMDWGQLAVGVQCDVASLACKTILYPEHLAWLCICVHSPEFGAVVNPGGIRHLYDGDYYIRVGMHLFPLVVSPLL